MCNVTLSLRIAPTTDSMHRAFDQLSSWLATQPLSDSTTFRLRIIAEELMSNVTRHAAVPAEARVTIGPSSVTFTLIDDGAPFDPTAHPDLGYGLMIANGAASHIDYSYTDDHNVTTVTLTSEGD